MSGAPTPEERNTNIKNLYIMLQRITAKSKGVTQLDQPTQVKLAEAAKKSEANALRKARNDDDGLVWRLGGPATSSPVPFAAGERAAASDAPVEALRFFTWAVDAAVEAEPPAAELLHVLRRLALSAELASRLDVADRALRRAATLTDDPVTLAALCEHRGRIRDRQGRFEVALRWYRRGRRHLGDGSVGGDDARAAWLELELGRAQALGRLRRLRPSERVLRAVLDDPRTDDHRALLARACTLLAGVLGDLGDAEATAWRDRSFPIYEELGDLVGQARALGNRGVDAYYDGDWDLAVELYERAGELAERAGDSLNQILLRSNLAEVLSDRGDLARASELLLDVLATARAAGYDAGTALAHGNLGRAATRAGDVEGAREHLAEARRRWEAMGDDAMVVEIDIREAERLLADGEPQAALERVEQARVAGFRVDALAWLGPPLDRVAALAEARLGAAATALVRLTAARDAAAGVSRIDELWILEATVDVLRQLDRRDEADRVDTERRALARELGID